MTGDIGVHGGHASGMFPVTGMVLLNYTCYFLEAHI